MKFTLIYRKTPQIYVNAKNEYDAWKKIKKAGIKNKSKLFQLIRVKNEYK